MSELMECKFSNCFMCGEDNKCHKAYQQGRADALTEAKQAPMRYEQAKLDMFYKRGRTDMIGEVIDGLNTMHDMVGIDNKTLDLLIRSLQLKEQTSGIQ